MTKILILGDTHLQNFEDLPQKLNDEIQKADWVIHTGDYTSIDVLNGFIKKKGENFHGVYGNTDPLSIRNKVPYKTIIQIQGKKIGIIHPAKGGLLKNPINRIFSEFRDQKVDILVYGHTHESNIENSDGILFINPGKGYLEENSFNSPATFALLTIDKQIQAEIKKL